MLFGLMDFDLTCSLQTQQLQMLPMSNPDVNPGVVETQQMRVVAPVGASNSNPLFRKILTVSLECCSTAAANIIFGGRQSRSRTSRFHRVSAWSDFG
jgi:hypothetical protein